MRAYSIDALRSSDPYDGSVCDPDAHALLRKVRLCLSKLLRLFRPFSEAAPRTATLFCEWTIES